MSIKLTLSENKFNLIICEEEKNISINSIYSEIQKNQTLRYKIIHTLAEKGYVFHGTNETFNEFDFGKIKGGFRGKEGYGFYFTKDAYKLKSMVLIL